LLKGDLDMAIAILMAQQRFRISEERMIRVAFAAAMGTVSPAVAGADGLSGRPLANWDAQSKYHPEMTKGEPRR
jgi:hypothetical protein